MKFRDFFEFKDELDKVLNLVRKGEDVIITKSGKPILSLAGINKDDLEDYILAKKFKLESKAKDIETGGRFLSHKEVKKRLGL